MNDEPTVCKSVDPWLTHLRTMQAWHQGQAAKCSIHSRRVDEYAALIAEATR